MFKTGVKIYYIHSKKAKKWPNGRTILLFLANSFKKAQMATLEFAVFRRALVEVKVRLLIYLKKIRSNGRGATPTDRTKGIKKKLRNNLLPHNLLRKNLLRKNLL